jgi:hypothetical protein
MLEMAACVWACCVVTCCSGPWLAAIRPEMIFSVSIPEPTPPNVIAGMLNYLTRSGSTAGAPQVGNGSLRATLNWRSAAYPGRAYPRKLVRIVSCVTQRQAIWAGSFA